MNFSKISKLAFSIACCMSFFACSAKVTVQPEAESGLNRVVAVLPSEIPPGVQRERVMLLRELLYQELSNNGFLVLEERSVREVCRTSECFEKLMLKDRFGVEVIARLDIDSTREVNFVAGYYNTLSGALNMTTIEGEELVLVEHTERERGGVVFESGQVFQGVISQVRNSEPEKFDRLGVKFIRTLVDKLPNPKKTEPKARSKALANVGVQIDSISTKKIKGNSVKQICVNGSPAVQAVLRLGPRRSTLRETMPGQYCGIFRLDDLSDVDVELRSPFGNSARKPLFDSESKLKSIALDMS